MVKKHLKKVVGLTVLGVGSGGLAIAGSAVPGGGAASTAFAQHLPLTGNVVGAGMVMEEVQSLKTKKKRRR